MNDTQGILSEYLPLELITFGDVYADEDGDPNAWLSEYDFIWEPIVDSRHKPQLYFGDELVRFKPEGRDKTEALSRRTGGQPLRMPKVSLCWGRQSLLIAKELADELQFSDKLGVTVSETEVYDAAGYLHTGFRAFSFHKEFFHERFENRFAEVSDNFRPLVCISLSRFSSTFLIHKSVFERWQQMGVEEVNYDIDEKHLSLDYLMNLEFYSNKYSQRCFFNMDDFQKNQNAHID